jgi:AraC-like DNA-binding protein
MQPINQTLDQQYLIKHAINVRNYRIFTPKKASRIEGSLPVVQGSLLTQELQPGLVLHKVDARAVNDFSFTAQIDPGLRVSLLFAGETHLTYGKKSLLMHADTSKAHVTALTEADGCTLASRKGEYRQAVNIAMSESWLAKQGFDSQAMRRATHHLAAQQIKLPEFVVQQASQLFNQLDAGAASRLSREGFALTLAAHIIENWQQAPLAQGTAKVVSRRSQQFMDFLLSGEADALTLEQISQVLGMSAATLQRYAHQCLGSSLTHFLRQRRLINACKALQQEGVSISDAALLAGYSHTANFATAFKRQFGVCPTDAHRYALTDLLMK